LRILFLWTTRSNRERDAYIYIYEKKKEEESFFFPTENREVEMRELNEATPPKEMKNC
jgi:hypothetical protein